MQKGYLLVFLTAIISGFSIFINKFGVKGINPYIYTFLRVIIVATFLSGLLLAFKDLKSLKLLTKKQWLLLILVGLVGGSIPFLLFFKGLSLTTAAKSSFIHKTMFIYVAILAKLILKEKIDKKFLLGGIVLLIGNLILLKKIPSEINYGDLLVFFATLLWATENTISKYLLKDLNGRQLAWGRMFFGSLFILLFLLFTNQTNLIFNLNLKQISWVLITAFILFGYVMTWYSGLKYIPVSQATAILLLGGPITTLLSLLSAGKIVYSEILSGLLIILGIIILVGIKESFKILKKIKQLIYVRS